LSIAFLLVLALILITGAIVLFGTRKPEHSGERRSRLGVTILAGLVLMILTFGLFLGPGVYKSLMNPRPNPEALRRLPIVTGFKDPNAQTLEVNRKFYSAHGYGILDFGDIRFAVRGWNFLGTSTGNWSQVSGPVSGGSFRSTSRAGGSSMSYGWNGGTSTGTGSLADFEFTVQDAEISLGNIKIPMTEGKKIVFIAPDGVVESIEEAPAVEAPANQS